MHFVENVGGLVIKLSKGRLKNYVGHEKKRFEFSLSLKRQIRNWLKNIQGIKEVDIPRDAFKFEVGMGMNTKGMLTFILYIWQPLLYVFKNQINKNFYKFVWEFVDIMKVIWGDYVELDKLTKFYAKILRWIVKCETELSDAIFISYFHSSLHVPDQMLNLDQKNMIIVFHQNVL